MAPKQPTVLLTVTRFPPNALPNDDGPPSAASPYIFGLYKHFVTLGWDVRVVIPSSQKSWIGKAYHLNEIIHGRFYYPRDPDGLGETSDAPRALKDGEIGEWTLLDGTPASCSNIALHNLYPGEIDLLVSGPNLGRNTSCAFAMSSGTVGAALSSALSRTRSIALSYGTVEKPTPENLFEPAHVLSAKLFAIYNGGGLRNGEIDLYSVNIPMIPGLLREDGLPIIWTRLWRNSYHRLFKAYSPERAAALEHPHPQAGPDSIETTPAQTISQEAGGRVSPKRIGDCNFINLPPSSLPEGSDSWAIEMGLVSVTPMRASFGEPPAGSVFEPGGTIQDRLWKIKL
ncbi:sure-like protein [Russula vinacea]|nr:sure-like protein [Russula vinacea]